MTTLCRDCGTLVENPADDRRCASCGSPRLKSHAELASLALAHIDCDAFYATVEKRDNPALLDRPVIVGGEHRGVVAACCYVARLSGVRSAMPMFKALKACPDAVVIKPDMAKYRAVGRQVRQLMLETTPLVEPLSIDEAFLDLSGTEKLHHGPPARTLALLVRRIEGELGVTASIGLSYNKFLAKVASDLDKPRGFAIIGRGEAVQFLSSKPVSLIWGVGNALQQRLARDGISVIGQLLEYSERDLGARYGAIGRRLYRFARGDDDRLVTPDAPAKSISAETTFNSDIRDADELARILHPLAERVAERLLQARRGASGVALKLKTADFQTITRSRQLSSPTQTGEFLYRAALPLLEQEADGREFRLIGIGAEGLVDQSEADLPDLFQKAPSRDDRLDRAIDAVRDRVGKGLLQRGPR